MKRLWMVLLLLGEGKKEIKKTGITEVDFKAVTEIMSSFG